jgi:hypothetical protein
MLLPREQALRFIAGYKSVLLRVLSNTKMATTQSVNNDLAAARSLINESRDLLETAFDELAAEGKTIETDVVEAIRSIRIDQWVYVKHTKTFAVFMDKEAKNAYAVRALTTPLNHLLDEPPFLLETGLFKFQGVFVCDGLAIDPVPLGPGYRAQLLAAYSSLRKSGHFYQRTEA